MKNIKHISKIPAHNKILGVENLLSSDYMSEECELLTTYGWKPVSQITYNDLLATYNIFTNFVEWQLPLNIFTSDFDDAVIHYENDNIDMLITQSHPVLCRANRMIDTSTTYIHFKYIPNSELKKSVNVKKTARNSFVHVPEFLIFYCPIVMNVFNNDMIFKDIHIPMDTWLMFIGNYISFGELSYVIGTIIFNIKVVEPAVVYAKIYTIASFFPHDFDVNYTNDKNTILLRCMSLYGYLKVYGSGNNRKLGNYMLTLNTRQTRILLNSILISSTYSNFRYLVNYQTDSMLLADQIQMLAFNAEYSANIISTETETFKKVFIDIAKNKKICVVISNKLTECEPRLDTSKKLVTKFSGKTYNILSYNNITLVRRNKKYCWI